MDRPKTLVSHLEELRKRLLIIIIVFISITASLLFFPSFFDSFSARMFKWLYSYFLPIIKSSAIQVSSGPVFIDPLEPMLVNLKLASFVAGIITVPVLVSQIFAFVAPAMNSRRDRLVLGGLLFGSIALFASGLALSFFLLVPITFSILMTYGISMGLVPMLTAGKFFSLAFWMVFIFALPFELPLVMWFLSYLGVISPERMKKARKAMWVGISIFSAIITPDPTPFSMLVLTVSLILLYELGIIIAVMFKKKTAKIKKSKKHNGKREAK